MYIYRESDVRSDHHAWAFVVGRTGDGEWGVGEWGKMDVVSDGPHAACGAEMLCLNCHTRIWCAVLVRRERDSYVERRAENAAYLCPFVFDVTERGQSEP